MISKSIAHLEQYNKRLVDIKGYNEFVHKKVSNALKNGEFGGKDMKSAMLEGFLIFTHFDTIEGIVAKEVLKNKGINFGGIYDELDDDTRRQCLDLYSVCHMIGDWLEYKQIYKFDVDTLEMLSGTNQEITNEVLEGLSLPYSVFFIENEFDLGGKCDSVLIKVSKSEKGREFGFYIFYEDEQERFKHEMKLYRTYQGEFDEQMQDCEESAKAFYQLMFNLLMYLAQPKVEILKKSSGIKERKNNKSFYNITYDENEVGYKLGNAIRNYRVRYLSESTNHKTGGVKKPHLRCGHFHHYWTGKGRTDLVVKYVEPTFIKGGSKVATIHKVKN